MKSPITGKEMSLTYEWRSIPFRKENFEIKYQFYLCEESGEHFTTTELDELNMQMVHNLYRIKHHIPTSDEIRAIRKKYDLSASRMSDILGFGPNTYRLYEAGDVPSIPNANLIKTARSPEIFNNLVQEGNDERNKDHLLKKVNRIIEEQLNNRFDLDFSNYLMGSTLATEYTGFKKPSLDKLSEMIVFFAQESPCYQTKMNKLLFYSDFSSFKSSGQSISGTIYKAIPYGPVPQNFESIFEKLAEEDVIDSFYKKLPDGSLQKELKGRTDRPFNSNLFDEGEMKTLKNVANIFKNVSTGDMVKISHDELGWIENQESKSAINYHYAFDLKAI